MKNYWLDRKNMLKINIFMSKDTAFRMRDVKKYPTYGDMPKDENDSFYLLETCRYPLSKKNSIFDLVSEHINKHISKYIWPFE